MSINLCDQEKQKGFHKGWWLVGDTQQHQHLRTENTPTYVILARNWHVNQTKWLTYFSEAENKLPTHKAKTAKTGATKLIIKNS